MLCILFDRSANTSFARPWDLGMDPMGGSCEYMPWDARTGARGGRWEPGTLSLLFCDSSDGRLIGPCRFYVELAVVVHSGVERVP